MSEVLPVVYEARHGETAWSATGQHTGLTDLPLTKRGERADRVVSRIRAIKGNVLIFSSGRFLRVFTARWLGLEPFVGKFFMLDVASLSGLSYEHDLSNPAIRFWNDTWHAGD